MRDTPFDLQDMPLATLSRRITGLEKAVEVQGSNAAPTAFFLCSGIVVMVVLNGRCVIEGVAFYERFAQGNAGVPTCFMDISSSTRWPLC